MKRVAAILLSMLTFACLLSLTACKTQTPPPGSSTSALGQGGKTDESAYTAQTEIVKSFFSYFENADYESMKTLCTPDCIDQYFHQGDVFGMESATLTKMGEELTRSSPLGPAVFVDVQMITAVTSALYPDTETSFYVLCKEQMDGSWLIDGFATG